MNCNDDCKCNIDYNDEDDDFEIQRLQDIITICEFLIKHKRNQKYRDKLDQLLDDLIDKKDDNDQDDNNDNSNVTRVIYQPIYYPPWQNGSQTWTWSKRKYPWNNNIWS